MHDNFSKTSEPEQKVLNVENLGTCNSELKFSFEFSPTTIKQSTGTNS